MIWWEDFHDSDDYEDRASYIENDLEYFERFTNEWSDIEIFDVDGDIDWTDVIQGGAGTCYLKASMAAMAEFPDLVRASFVNSAINDEGIYNVRFFIRGKPWVVTIDDYLLFEGEQDLVFASTSTDENAIWAALLEKAYAKIIGTYTHADGGYTANGIRTLTGLPVYEYYSSQFGENDSSLEEMWDLLMDADDNDYIMGAGTSGDGDDSYSNDCGIAKSHAYSIVAAFEMDDSDDETHRMLLIRNPWGSNGYSWDWNADDSDWTADLIAQIPHGFDPTAQTNDDTGLFVVPIEAFTDNDDVGYCFADI